jgi:uncharacterized protein
MLGRLARYLRFFGHDTEYLRGLEDGAIVERVRAEKRVLLTRDRQLASRASGSVLVRSPIIGEQLRQVRDAFPQMAYTPTFDRCPECNDLLGAWRHAPGTPWPPELPRERVEAGLAVFECPGCRRHYWDGSHTDRIRERVETWLGGQRS